MTLVSRRQAALGLSAGLVGATIPIFGRARAAENGPGALEAEFTRLEAAINGRFGVTALDTATGRRASHRGGERFPMCSTFKALVCAAVLARVDAGRETLDRKIAFSAAELAPHSPVTAPRVGGAGLSLAALCEAAMTQSDNTAANLILTSLGGPAAVTDYARSLGDLVTRLDRMEPALNEATPGDPRDTTTPDAMAANLDKIVRGNALSPRSRGLFADWLAANRTGDERLRAGVPRDWRIGDKTGGGDRGTTNDIAVIWPRDRAPLVVCVYLTECAASLDARNAAIASVGQALARSLGP
jgi:beta-lactamase class A